jgi:hypothetical protein
MRSQRRFVRSGRVPRALAAAFMLLPAATPAGARQAALDPATLERLRSSLQAQLDSVHAGARFPGATLAVALPDGRVIAFATGWADRLSCR